MPCPGSVRPYYSCSAVGYRWESHVVVLSSKIDEGSAHFCPDRISGEMPLIPKHTLETSLSVENAAGRGHIY